MIGNSTLKRRKDGAHQFIRYVNWENRFIHECVRIGYNDIRKILLENVLISLRIQRQHIAPRLSTIDIIINPIGRFIVNCSEKSMYEYATGLDQVNKRSVRLRVFQ